MMDHKRDDFIANCFNKVILLLFLLLLVACSDDEKADPSLVTGIASKGIIINGLVTAYPIVNGQIIRDTIIGTAATDSRGKYTLTISPTESIIDLGAAGTFKIGGNAGYSGPLFIVVGPDPLGSSKMKCDAPQGCAEVAFGETIELNFTLESVVPAVSPGRSVNASITPLTHMAAAAAKQNGLGKDGIEAANKKVAAMFGLSDIVAAQIVDVTDSSSIQTASADELKNSYLAAAIASLAQTKFSGDIEKVLKNLSDSYNANNGELIQSEISGQESDDIISLSEIMQAAVNNINNDSMAQSDTDIATAANELENLSNSASEPTAAGALTSTTVDISSTDIDAAKSIVSTINTWSSQTKKLEVAGEQFVDNLEAANKVSETFLDTMGEALDFTVSAMIEDYKNSLQGATGPFTLSENAQDKTTIDATGDILINTNQRTVSVTNAQVTVNGVTNTVNLSLTLPTESGNSIIASVLANSMIANENVKLTIKSGSISIYFENSYSDLYELNETGTLGDNKFANNFPSGLDLDLSIRLEQLETSTTDNPFYFEGLAIVDALRGFILNNTENDEIEDDNFKNLRFSKIILTGDIGFKNGEKISCKFTGNMANASSWSPDQQAIDSLPVVGTIKSEFAKYTFSADKNTMKIKMINDEEFVIRLGRKRDSSNFREINVYIINLFDEEDEVDYFISSKPGDNLLEILNNQDTLQTRENGTYSFYLFDEINLFVPSEGEYETRFPNENLNLSATGGTLNGILVEQDFLTKDLGESPTNYRKLDAKMEFSADFLTNSVNLPPASITLTAKRTGVVAAELSATAKYDNITLIFSITGDLTNGAQGIDIPSLVVIDSATSARLTIYPEINGDDIKGNIVVNGNGIGSIEATSSGAIIVRYINGDINNLDFASGSN